MSHAALRRPAALRPGDQLRVLSPSGPVWPQHVEAGVAMMRAWGFCVEVDPDAFARTAHGYLAGEDAARLDALWRAWCDPQVAAIVCSRGGYGAMRLLDGLVARLERTPPERATPPLLVGFSDITALHLLLAGRFGVCTLHGPVAKSLPNQPEAAEALRSALLGHRDTIELALRPHRAGAVTGPLYPVNLSLLCALLGSPHCPDLTGAILVIEDVGEPDYRLDRMITSLRLAATTRDLGGIIVGEFESCGGVYIAQPEIEGFVADTIAATFPDLPVALGAPVGHARANLPLPVGAPATLQISQDHAMLHVHHDATCPFP